MIARFHYDRNQLQAFLDEDPSADPNEIQSHVETCSHCQAELETLAQADFDWDQATQLLGVEQLPPTDCLSQKTVEDNCSSILQPTGHPDSLGRFARYEIMEILGRGGMGVVMRGYDTSLNRHSAIKVLAPELASNAAARKRFSREAKSAAAVVHPHVVPIQTVDEHNGIPYLVMPVVEPTWCKLPACHAPQTGSSNFLTPWRLLVATAAFAFFALAGAIIYLETSKGTLRIESNVESQVPIVIRQDGEVVQELTVTQKGTTARLRAGKYSIEAKAEDTSVELRDNQVTIKAGGQWVARIEMKGNSTSDRDRRDPAVVRQDAVDDAKNGRHESAFEKILWCWQHGVQAKPSWSAVRRSFLLSDWIDLADSYPPALEKLKSIRDGLRERIVSENQLRVQAEDFADLAAIHRVLREEHRSIEAYQKLDPRDQQRLYFFLPYCPTMNKPEANNCKQCHQAYPTIGPALGNQHEEPPKISPFTRMEFDDDRVIVTYGSRQYELLGVDRFSIEELERQTRNHYGEKWKKRLSEDLVEVFWQMGYFPGQTVDLRLRSLETDKNFPLKTPGCRRRIARDSIATLSRQ